MKDSPRNRLIMAAFALPLMIWALSRGCTAELAASRAQAPAPVERIHLRPDQVEAMELLKSQGYLEMRLDTREAYLSPLVWLAADARLKEDLAATLAVYGADLRHDDNVYVTVMDKQSAKRLAKWDGVWGFKVY
jgi:hypothetical protein